MPFEILKAKLSKVKPLPRESKPRPIRIESRLEKEARLGRFATDLYQKNLHRGEAEARKIMEKFLEKNGLN